MNLPPHLQHLNTNILSQYQYSLPLTQTAPTISSNNNTVKPTNNTTKAKKKAPKKGDKEKESRRSRVDKSKLLKKKWKVLRKAGGEAWEDPTMEEWPENDFRIFCGDLGNEVSDEILSNAFRKYPSFQKARVVRDKRTGKTRGFGFISFANSDDYIKAMREMHGKYVGNRPIRLKKSDWKDRSLTFSKSQVENVKFIKNKTKIRKNFLMNNNNSGNNVPGYQGNINPMNNMSQINPVEYNYQQYQH